jgi:ribosomal protein L11 methyltransferase
VSADYIQINLRGEEKLREILSAELFSIGIDSVYESEMLHAYIKKDLFTENFESELKELCSKYNYQYNSEPLANINWNAEWERSFEPVSIGDYCLVKAAFHDVNESFQHTIEINPKMSFGTGHHETTWLMIDLMSKLELKDKKVLDYGCGTGILAILAEKEKAVAIDAIDIDTLCVENSEENLQINNCKNINIILGDIDIIDAAEQYDLILANINRNVLLSNANAIAGHLKIKGDLLLSGILEADKGKVIDKYKSAGFSMRELKQRGEWLCIYFTKSTNS